MTDSTPTAAAVSSPAASYLQQADACLAAVRTDMPRLIDFGRRIAERLLAGGDLVLAPVRPYVATEFAGRAGGLMRIATWIKGRHEPRLSEDRTALFAMPHPERLDADAREVLDRLADSPAKLFAIGREQDVAAAGLRDRVEASTGGVARDAGGYRHGVHDPLVPMWPLDEMVRGWVVMGELITACIRAGRMPRVWMSVWLDGAFVRNASMVDSEPLREPFGPTMFHEPTRYVPPLAEGYAGHAFVDALEAIHRRLTEQQAALERAGDHLAAALRNGRRARAVLVGHAYPQLLGLGHRGGDDGYPVSWGRSVSDLARAVPDDFADGDAMVHLGYGPLDVEAVRQVVDRGVRLIHSSPYGPRPGMVDDDRFVWLDLPWRPGDAIVDVPGYSSRILPSSSSSMTMAWFAILSQTAERMTWE